MRRARAGRISSVSCSPSIDTSAGLSGTSRGRPTWVSRWTRCWRGRVGVCQDFAHLAVAMCRSIGIPARYVSGYLFTTNDATGEDPEADVVRVQTHAWFEAAVPGVGWLALDPTNSSEVGLRHVTIGHGRDYDDVPPLRGSLRGRGHAFARRQRRHPSLGTHERRGGRRRCASARDPGGAAANGRGARPARSSRPASATGPAVTLMTGGSLQP